MTAAARKKAGRVSRACLGYAALILLAVFFLFPVYIMVASSFMLEAESLQLDPKVFIPSTLNIGTYLSLFMSGSAFLVQLKNSLFIAALNVVGIPLTASLCAYGFAKVKFKGSDKLFAVVLATIMIPGAVTMVPLYVIFARLGWLNTTLPLWAPAWFGGGVTNIFLLRQFMRGISDEMVAAAKIDGAGTFRIYWQIVMPMCMPIVIFIAVQTFIGSWNDFMGPFLYINEARKYTLSLGLYMKYGINGVSPRNPPNYSMAAAVLMTVPSALLFFVFQKKLIEGATITGFK